MLLRSRGSGGRAALALLLLAAVLGNAGAFLQQPQPARRGAGGREAMRMLAKRVSFGDKGLDQLVAGINIVGNAVKVRVWVVFWVVSGRTGLDVGGTW